MSLPYIELNPASDSPLILLGEHAGFSIPAHMNRLGVPEITFQDDQNFAGDHGVRHILYSLARQVGMTTIMGRYSRLLIDLNRSPDHPDMLWTKHHGVPVPVNADLSAAEKEERMNSYYWPFHNRVRYHIERLVKSGKRPVLLTVHSYTPKVAEKHAEKPKQFSAVDIGLLYGQPSPLLEHFDWAFLNSLKSMAHNQPYDLRAMKTGSLLMHQQEHNLDGLALEINVDLLKTILDQKGWADLINRAIRDFLLL